MDIPKIRGTAPICFYYFCSTSTMEKLIRCQSRAHLTVAVRLLAAFWPVVFFVSRSLAQPGPNFQLPKTLHRLEWIKAIDRKNPNVYQIDSALQAYKKRRTAGDMGNGEKEEMEDPFEMAWVRLLMHNSAFIRPDGTIKIDSGYHVRTMQAAIAGPRDFIPRQRATQISTPRAAQIRTVTGSAPSIPRSTTPLGGTTANWTPLGPINTFDNSAQVSCYQSNTYRIAMAPSNTSIVYAGSESCALFKSTDKGLHWTPVSEALPPINPGSIIVDPSNPGIAYCYDVNSGLLKTTDGGTTWTLLSQYGKAGGNNMAIQPGIGRILIAGTTAIYYSDDGGATWSQASGANIGSSGIFDDLVLNATNPSIVYAVGHDGNYTLKLYVSADGGNTFTLNSSAALSGVQNAGARLAATPANGNVVYCIALGNTQPPTLFKSTDGGATWFVAVAATGTGLGGNSTTTGLGMSNGQGYYDLSIMADPNNASNVIVGTTSSYKSTDGGSNFSPLSGYAGGPFTTHVDFQCMRAIGNDAFISTDGGVNYSSDFFTATSNWSIRNVGLTASEYWGIGQGWAEDLVVGGRYHNGDAALFEGYGVGNNLVVAGGEPPTGEVFFGFPPTAGFRDIGTFQLPSSLPGLVMTAAANNTLWPNQALMFSGKLMIDPRYSNVYYVGSDSILWISSNYGASYSALHNFGSGNTVWRFDIARSNYIVMFLCAPNGLYKSTDGGNSWSVITSLPVAWAYWGSDVAINPLNENEVYLCMAQGSQSAARVFKSVDGGSTWTNITGTALTGKAPYILQYQGGPNGGIYVLTKDIPSRGFYRDNTMSDWINFSDGLANSNQFSAGGTLFFRDNKFRAAGLRHVWETPLYSPGAPVGQPMANKQYVSCSIDTVNFQDYSILNYNGATWNWSFPAASYVSSASTQNPKVVYSSPGSYDVTLTVTDALNQTHTRTVKNMISFTTDNCVVDTVAGKCVQLKGGYSTIPLGKVNLNSNSFSISCWIKPKGLEKSFSQILGTSAYPGSAYGFGIGFNYNGYTPNLRLCYTDNTTGYYNSSGLICDSSSWNFVVLSYSPAGVTLYLNGVPEIVNNHPMAAIDLTGNNFFVNFDVLGQGGDYQGLIDEVKFYNYALSQNDVREKMHLIQSNGISEPGLIKYYQFNFYDNLSGSVHDLVSGFSSAVPAGINVVPSSAPVATGGFFRNPSVSTGGMASFPAADLDLYLSPNSGAVYPNGEMVAFHLRSGPDQSPSPTIPAVGPGYFIIENFGSNKIFTPPDSIRFHNLSLTDPYPGAGDLNVYRRSSNAYGNTWGNPLAATQTLVCNGTGSSVKFGSNRPIDSSNQVTILNTANPLPIVLENLTASADNAHRCIPCHWETAGESGPARYAVQRTSDCVPISTIAA